MITIIQGKTNKNQENGANKRAGIPALYNILKI